MFVLVRRGLGFLRGQTRVPLRVGGGQISLFFVSRTTIRLEIQSPILVVKVKTFITAPFNTLLSKRPQTRCHDIAPSHPLLTKNVSGQARQCNYPIAEQKGADGWVGGLIKNSAVDNKPKCRLRHVFHEARLHKERNLRMPYFEIGHSK